MMYSSNENLVAIAEQAVGLTNKVAHRFIQDSLRDSARQHGERYDSSVYRDVWELRRQVRVADRADKTKLKKQAS